MVNKECLNQCSCSKTFFSALQLEFLSVSVEAAEQDNTTAAAALIQEDESEQLLQKKARLLEELEDIDTQLADVDSEEESDPEGDDAVKGPR